MARYRGSVCKFCRRERLKLFLKGDRCYSEKCSVDRRPYPPGVHGQRRPKFSPYGEQLREKQKVKRIYGFLEKQFRLTFQRASRMKGVKGENLLLCWSGAWTTWSTAWVSRARAGRPANWCGTGTSG